jgi:hypothetical protein
MVADTSPPLPPSTAAQALAALWSDAALPADALRRVTLPGGDPVVPSSFRIATALQASLGAAALAAGEIGRLRGGPVQRVSVDATDVVRECMGRFTLGPVSLRRRRGAWVGAPARQLCAPPRRRVAAARPAAGAGHGA